MVIQKNNPDGSFLYSTERRHVTEAAVFYQERPGGLRDSMNVLIFIFSPEDLKVA